jgi:arylsulfatase A-like enzyme
MVMDLDKSIGKLLKAYEALGLSENTYIIFTSDNGGMPVLPIQVNRGRPYKQGLNSPLLRGKWDLMEGGIRVPFAIAGPNIPQGVVSDTPVVGYDILPTIVELAEASNVGEGITLSEDIDGGSFAQVALKDPMMSVERSNEALIFHFPHYNSVGLQEPHSAIRMGDYKLVKFYSSERSLLFDLSKDISESKDLSKKQKARAEKLEKHLSDYLTSVDAEIPEGSFTWKRPGEHGAVKTQFFKRYD